MSKPTLGPRKLPRQARAIVTRDSIVEAAARILAEGGLPAFNTNAVALRAGVSVGSLYQYFPNKDALMAALIAREQDRRVDGLTALAATLRGQSLRAKVEAVVGAVVTGETRMPQLAMALDHAEQRLAVNDALDAAGLRLDELLADLVAPHLADLDGRARLQACRSVRLAVRAVVDDALNRAVPDPKLAISESIAIALARFAASDR